jgi:kynurenine formamidase
MKHLAALILVGAMIAMPATAIQAQTQQSPAAPREILTQAQFYALFKQVSNWGRWGSNDQLGTLNLITPALKKAAAALVREGVSVSLARDLNTEKAIDNPDPFQDKMSVGVGDEFNMDTYTVNFHGFAFSHFDSLAHTYYEGKLYNGYPAGDISKNGGTVLDAAQYKDGIFTRGVLVDIPWLRGLPYLEKDAYITAHDLDLWEAKTGVHIKAGDAVAIRTGRWALRNAKGPWDISAASAGLDPSVALWLHKRDVAFLVSDAAHDAIPSAVKDVVFPIHVLTIVAMGMPLADQCNLEDVARESLKLKRQTFLLTLAPVRIKGGTGALINPIATF